MEIWGINIWTLRIIFMVLGVVLSIWGTRLVWKYFKVKTTETNVVLLAIGVSCAIGAIITQIIDVSAGIIKEATVVGLSVYWAILLVLAIIFLSIVSKKLKEEVKNRK